MRQIIVFGWLLSLNVFGLIFFLNHISSEHASSMRVLDYKAAFSAEFVSQEDKFDDPILAYQLLTALDTFKLIDIGLSPEKVEKFYRRGSFLGLTTDNKYCEKHRAYFVSNPGFIFNEKNFVTSVGHGSKIRRKVIPALGGNDTMPQVYNAMPAHLANQPVWDIRVDTNAFYLATIYTREIGKHFACLTQIHNHIPGHDDLYRKDRASYAMMQYKKKYAEKPQCFDPNKYFPQTWLMKNGEQCRDFFNEFNSPHYHELKSERKIVFLRKIGYDAHGKWCFSCHRRRGNSY